MPSRLKLMVLALVVALCACSNEGSGVIGAEELFPSVISVDVSESSPGFFDFSVTLSSPYDGPDRYADAWRIRDLDGAVLGVRELTHHHAAEQPFTRSLAGVAIPDDIDRVVVEGRDLVNGWGGKSVEVELR